jgi:MFS family permease
MVAAMVGWYGLFTIASGVSASSLGALTLMRALTGAGEAASMPAATSGVARWVPKERRALAQGIMHATTRVGAAVTVPAAVACLYAFGIAGPFWVFGLATLIVAVLWLAIYRDPVLDGSPKQRAREGAAVWRAILTSRSFWALCLADFCYFYTVNIYLTWLPTFLVQDRHFTLMRVGIYGFLPFLGGSLGGVAGGYLCDRLGARSGNHRFWRRFIPTCGMVGSVALLLPAVYAPSQMATIALFTCSFFCLDATISVFWAIAMDIGGEYAATTAGWMNTWANVGGVVSPLAFGVLVQASGSWALPFLVASALMLVGAALVWLIDPDFRIAHATERAGDSEARATA